MMVGDECRRVLLSAGDVVTALSSICGCGMFISFVPMWISSFGLAGLTHQLGE